MAVSFSLRAHPLGGLSCRDHRKVDLGVSGSIEVVREDVQRDMRDDLRDLAIRETSTPDTCELLIADAAAALEHGHRELQCCRQETTAQSAAQCQVSLEHARRLCHRPHHVGHDAELLLDSLEVPANTVVSCLQDGFDSAHTLVAPDLR
jgi:hypothetical protein